MKTWIYILLAFTLPFWAGAETLRPGDKVEYSLEYKFNREAKERSEWLLYALEFNDADQINLFDIAVAGKDNVEVSVDAANKRAEFKILAGAGKTDLKDSDLEAFILTLTYKEGLSSYPEGEEFYPRLSVIDASESLKGNISALEGELYIPMDQNGNPIFADEDTNPKTILKGEPMAMWLIIPIGVLVLALAGGLAFVILKRDDMPLGRKTFQGGSLSITDNKNNQVFIQLDGDQYKYGFTLSLGSGIPLLEASPAGLKLTPADRICRYKRKNKRFCVISYEIVDFTGVIKNDYSPDAGPDHISGDVLYNHDVLTLKKNDQFINIQYTNAKLNRT